MNQKPPLPTFTIKDRLGFFTERHPLRLYIASIIVGVVTAFATIGFIRLYVILRKFFYHSKYYNFIRLSEYTPSWYYFVIFVGGGLLLGLFIYFILPNHGHGHGMPHLLYCFRRHEPLSIKEGLGSSFASAASIGIGASVGREAPLMFLGGALSSWFCKLFKFEGHYYRVLLCAAVGTAFATSMHASFIALFYVWEALAFSLTALDLIPITLAVFSGTIIREFAPDILPPVFLRFPATSDVDHIVYFVVLGVLCGLLAIFYVQTLKYTRKATLHSKLPPWAWLPIAGVPLSFIAIYAPSAMGLSFGTLAQSQYLIAPTFAFLITFLIFKTISTYLSLSFGFSGGIITPIFVMGLFWGSLYALGLDHLFDATTHNYSAYALGATAALTGAVIGAPLAMTIVTLEFTCSMPLTVNIFAAIVSAQIVMKLFKVGSYYHTQYTLLYGD